MRDKSERIERIHFAENLSISCWETEKKVLPLITRLGKEETLIILLSAGDRSCDSKAKRNLSKHMWWAYKIIIPTGLIWGNTVVQFVTTFLQIQSCLLVWQLLDKFIEYSVFTYMSHTITVESIMAYGPLKKRCNYCDMTANKDSYRFELNQI